MARCSAALLKMCLGTLTAQEGEGSCWGAELPHEATPPPPPLEVLAVLLTLAGEGRGEKLWGGGRREGGGGRGGGGRGGGGRGGGGRHIILQHLPIWSKMTTYTISSISVKGAQRMTSVSVKTPDYSPWFSARKGFFFDFGKKGYHLKGHLKGSRMVQISAP